MKKVSDKIVEFKIEGMLMPLSPTADVPIFLEIDGEHLLPIFSNREKFESAAKWGGFNFARCSIITDAIDFEKSVLHQKSRFSFHVVVDPYITPEGNTRFQMLTFDDEEKEIANERKP